MRLTMAKPSPVPRFLVEKYGKKSFSLSSRVTPWPESATVISTASRVATKAVEISISRTTEACDASAALSTRLATARLIASLSARIFGRSAASDLWTSIPSSRPLNIESAFSMTSLMSAGCGLATGKRARVENSSTSRRTVSTAPAIRLPPRCLLLGFQEVGEIFEHDDITGALAVMPEGGDGHGDVQRCPRQLHLHLAGGHAHAIGAPEQRFEIFQNLGGEHIGQRRAPENLRPTVTSGVGMKHAQQGLIDVGHEPPGIQREHAGRNTLEDGFHLTAALVELRIGRAQVAAGSLNLPPAAFQILRHAVEGAHQVANFVGGADGHAIVEASARDLLCGFRQR